MNRSVLLKCASLAVVCLLAVRPAAAYINVPAPTLGALCQQSTHIYVLKIEKFSVEKGVLLFKPVAQLKANGKLSDATLAKQVIPATVNGDKVKGAKVIFDWAAEGKTAVMFLTVNLKTEGRAPDPDQVLDLSRLTGTRGADNRADAQVCIDGYWYALTYEARNQYWLAVPDWWEKEKNRSGRPVLLSRYCGTAAQLAEALPRILRGEEVEVPARVGDTDEVRNLRASLQILGDTQPKKPEQKPEPGNKKPEEKKPEEKTLFRVSSG